MTATYRLVQVSKPHDLACLTAKTIAHRINLTLTQQERSQIILSGGATPMAAYRLLSQEHLPWERVDVFLSDERWVSTDDIASNSLMLRRTLLTSGTPGSRAVFHSVPTITLQSPDASAEAFAKLIAQACPDKPPVFHLVVLGLGEDGHTASLFPGTDALLVRNRWTTICCGRGLDRITITEPVLSAAQQVVFLVSGVAKRQALQRLLDPAESSERTPAKLVQPRNTILVLADKAAADELR